MSITPNDPARFEPSLRAYTGQGAFRFWCQQVLPITFDDSLSYYELLNKVVTYLNNTISDVANVEENVSALNDAYVKLQNYVNDYFSSLDVQEEINNKLDEMASNGTLNNLIEPFIPTAVTEWLHDNVEPIGETAIIDSSLSIDDAAANSKTVGDNVVIANRGLAKRIPAGGLGTDDLNNYNVPGSYYVANSTDAGNVDHSPYTGSGYNLYVFNTATGSNRIFQVVLVSAYLDYPEYSGFYIRHALRTDSDSPYTWTDWKQLADVYRVDKSISENNNTLYDTIYNNVILAARNLSEAITGTSEEHNDLNNYNTPGSYYVTNSTVASYVDNSPYTGSGYRLFVFDTATGGNKIYQIVLVTGYLNYPEYSGFYVRLASRTDSSSPYTWSEWKQIADVYRVEQVSTSISEEKINEQNLPVKLNLMQYNIGKFNIGDNIVSIQDNVATPVAANRRYVKSTNYEEIMTNYRNMFEKLNCDIIGIEENTDILPVYDSNQNIEVDMVNNLYSYLCKTYRFYGTYNNSLSRSSIFSKFNGEMSAFNEVTYVYTLNTTTNKYEKTETTNGNIRGIRYDFNINNKDIVILNLAFDSGAGTEHINKRLQQILNIMDYLKNIKYCFVLCDLNNAGLTVADYNDYTNNLTDEQKKQETIEEGKNIFKILQTNDENNKFKLANGYYNLNNNKYQRIGKFNWKQTYESLLQYCIDNEINYNTIANDPVYRENLSIRTPRSCIDNIIYRDNPDIIQNTLYVATSEYTGLASDHIPICAEFTIN